jgi:TetR/AcrR family transcriptional regulator, cholesterol catabolism regulator
MRQEIALMGDDILRHLDAELRADILRVIGHVWYSSLMTWANGRRDFESVITELDRAVHVLVDPHDTATFSEVRASPSGSHR